MSNIADSDTSAATVKTIQCNIDEQTFMRFAMTDTYRLKKYWKGPSFFSLLVFGLAALCFDLSDRKPLFPLLGSIFIAVGLLIPVFYFVLFKLAIKQKLKKINLGRDKVLYTLILKETGVTVCSDGNEAECSWDFVSKAYRDKACIYLYLNNEKAYLLPQYDGNDGTWKIIETHLGENAVILR